MTEPRSPQRRANTFDFLRLLAALAVVVQHATVHLDAPFLWLHPRGQGWFYDGVPAFFIISGLFVFRSAERLYQSTGTWRDYFVNRALRIIPAIWLYIVVAVGLVLAVGAAVPADFVGAQGLAWIASSVLLLPVFSPTFLDGFGVGAVNGSLWTIPVEISFYFVVPFIVVTALRFGQRRAQAGVLLLAAALMAGTELVGDGLPGKLLGVTFAPYLWYFALGMSAYAWRDRIRLTWPFAVVAIASYAALTVVHVPGVPHLLNRMVAAVFLCYAIVTVGERGPGALQTFTRRVGDLSFGTYVWHMVVVNTLLWFHADETWPERLLVPTVLVLTLAAAWLSWTIVERPALGLKSKSSRAPIEGRQVVSTEVLTVDGRGRGA